MIAYTDRQRENKKNKRVKERERENIDKKVLLTATLMVDIWLWELAQYKHWQG